jgi:Alpha/beta hydrolase domain containing 18
MLDQTYASAAHGFSGKFFARGWGDIHALDTSKFHRIASGIQRHPTHFLKVTWGRQQRFKRKQGTEYEITEGEMRYLGPGIRQYLPNVPECNERGKVWLLRPAGSDGAAGMQACVVHLAATGEHSRGCASQTAIYSVFVFVSQIPLLRALLKSGA